ncbi:MAG TPA: hypothetical protein VIG89_02160 [Candidatus Acidoferrales bacterium]
MKTQSVLSSLILTGLMVCLALGGPAWAQKGSAGAETPATVETNDTTSLYKLRGDSVRPGSLMNSTLYSHDTDCVRAMVQTNGKLTFFTEKHTDGPDGCRANPERFLTIEGSGFDLDGDGQAETVETVVADVRMDKLFSSGTTPASFWLLRTTFDSEGNVMEVAGGTGWKLEYASVPVTTLSSSARQVTASGSSAEATLCEVVQSGKKTVCQSRGTVNLPFEFTVTLAP